LTHGAGSKRNPVKHVARCLAPRNKLGLGNGDEHSGDEVANDELGTPIADEVRQMTIRRVVTVIRG